MSGPALKEISATTRICAVYGHPIKHSASPAMHNAAIAALGLDWRYVAFEVQPQALREAIAGARAMKFLGLNLTVPHKLLAVDLVDELDLTARTWGAVNTIRFETKDARGNWVPLNRVPADAISEIRSHGFNTDADAIIRALHEDLGVTVRGAKILVLGTGGAGRTAALRLAAEGVAELFLVNRTQAKADELAMEIRNRFRDVKASATYPDSTVDLLLNATSLGLKADDGSPMDEARFALRNVRAVYDMIYRPAETPLLRDAKAAGCRVANGIGMLLYQGAKAFEIWSEKPAPINVMRETLVKDAYGN